MKKLAFLSCIMALTVTIACGQDKSKRPSPPAKVTTELTSGATVTIDYSQPSLKGRTVGKEVAPYDGKVWRTGANEATIFEVSKDVKVEGQTLKAGKYGLYSIPGEKEWTFIFNKGWQQSGLAYKENEDVLRVKAKASKASQASEKMTFAVEKSGAVSLLWGNEKIGFKVQ